MTGKRKERGCSLSRTRRLSERREFLNFFKEREVFHFSLFSVYRVRNNLGHFRLGMTIKAKTESVLRSRVKRVVRESFRKLGPELGSYDYNLVIPRGKKLGFPFHRELGVLLQTRFRSVLGEAKE